MPVITSAVTGNVCLLVARYGEEHPGAWAGAWWDNEPTVRIVAAFTGDAASHDAALRPRLQHPDRLVVESRPHSLSDLRRVREEIERTLRQRMIALAQDALGAERLPCAVTKNHGHSGRLPLRIGGRGGLVRRGRRGRVGRR